MKKELDTIDTSFTVWLWPIVVPIGIVLILVVYTAFFYLVVGNWILDKTLNNDKLK